MADAFRWYTSSCGTAALSLALLLPGLYWLTALLVRVIRMALVRPVAALLFPLMALHLGVLYLGFLLVPRLWRRSWALTARILSIAGTVLGALLFGLLWDVVGYEVSMWLR